MCFNIQQKYGMVVNKFLSLLQLLDGFFFFQYLAEVGIEAVEGLGVIAFHVDGIITYEVLLIENSLVGTQKAPLDIAFAKANVEHLAICDWISVVAISTAFAGKAEVGRN